MKQAHNTCIEFARYAACPRLSLSVRLLAWYTAMTYTELRGHVRRNPRSSRDWLPAT